MNWAEAAHVLKRWPTSCAAIVTAVSEQPLKLSPEAARPLILAEGPGATSRSALGVVIFGGVSLATLFIVPSVYNLMARRTGSPNAIARRLRTLPAETAQ